MAAGGHCLLASRSFSLNVRDEHVLPRVDRSLAADGALRRWEASRRSLAVSTEQGPRSGRLDGCRDETPGEPQSVGTARGGIGEAEPSVDPAERELEDDGLVTAPLVTWDLCGSAARVASASTTAGEGKRTSSPPECPTGQGRALAHDLRDGKFEDVEGACLLEARNERVDGRLVHHGLNRVIGGIGKSGHRGCLHRRQ